MFERLRDAIDAFLDAATPQDPHDITRKMHAAVVETRAALIGLREDLAESQRKLAREKQRLADAERRGTMARDIDDVETAELADQYSAKHRDRAAVLEEKVLAQQHEIELAEREFEEMKVQLRAAKDQRGVASERVDEAWRNLESAGGGDSLADDALRAQLTRSQREAAAEDKLEELKKKMGR